jgi:transcriptional regulator with XRE-family HTH domain
MRFSDWLVKKLNDKGWSQSDLARKLEMSRQAINNLLSEQSKAPSMDTMQKLASVFEVSVEEVYKAAGVPLSVEVEDEWAYRIYRRIEKLRPELREIAEMVIDGLYEKEKEKAEKNSKRKQQ